MFHLFGSKKEVGTPASASKTWKSPFPKDLTRKTVSKEVTLPVPVMFLLDSSGSMSGDRIDALNSAVRRLLEDFRQEEARGVEYRVAVIQFESNAHLLFSFRRASEIRWKDLVAGGGTDLGKALTLAKELIEDRELTPSFTHKPTIVLISDGEPACGWKEPMKKFISEGRSQKCNRISMGIGQGADASVLNTFMKGTGNTLYTAKDASRISDFFRHLKNELTQLMHGETDGSK